jgi:hypothetical protein
LLPRKKARTHIILAQNFGGNNADSEYIRYVFLILISIFFSRRIPKKHIISAENLGENNANLVNSLRNFNFDFNIFRAQNTQNILYLSSKFWRK